MKDFLDTLAATAAMTLLFFLMVSPAYFFVWLLLRLIDEEQAFWPIIGLWAVVLFIWVRFFYYRDDER